MSIVERAIVELEDDQNVNAGELAFFRLLHGLQLVAIGFGSNLTMDGAVECDAAIMDGKTGAFGSVGAVSGAYIHYCYPES